MSRATDIPTLEQARCAVDNALGDAPRNGHRPSVLAVARQLGMSNTTFRRHFPDLAHEIGEARRAPQPQLFKRSPAEADQTRLAARNAKLRRDNRRLREHLGLAVTNIRHLTLTVHRLRTELEVASNVTRIDGSRRAD
ncbi:hypothetical protein [Nocardia pseudovaccinii]|uniref:hypothetical protein n=1 Tax=Nocardia pseudovaccinii TaxID=189540 RepID=UPI000ADD546E|nr:hypothetical protein [Nocardia pseudovaccinii]